MRVRTDDGVELAVEVEGGGPPLLLVHGFGGAKEDFADHAPAFARDHTVVRFDHRGHGESGKPPEPAAYSFERLVLDTLAVADALGFGRFRLLGHSMGGMVARELVLHHPARVEALVLMDTSPGPIPGWDPSLLDVAAEVALTRGKDELKALLDAFSPLDTPAYLRLLEERPGYREFCDAKWEALSEVMWASLVRAIARQPDRLADLARITCPTLVVVGEQDEPFLDVSRAMADTIPGAVLHVVPDAGHSPQFENPQAWAASVAGFLAGRVTTR